MSPMVDPPPTQFMAAGPTEPLSNSAHGLGLKKQRLRALIVEDELLVAWHLEALFGDLGHEVCAVAAHVDAAMSDFADFQPDLVFMDVNLGSGPNGLEVARRLRSMRMVPIVFVTAYTDAKTRSEMAEAAVGSVVLGKPVSPGELAQAVEAVTGVQH